MNATDLAYTPATELIPRIRSKALSPVELTRAVLERIEQVNPAINAFCTVTADAALAGARAAEAAVMKGEGRALPLRLAHLRRAGGRGGRAVRAAPARGGRDPDRQDHDP
jgi:hypothetical protein